MNIPKEFEKQINDHVPFEVKEEIYNQTRTPEDFRKWRVERYKKVMGCDCEYIQDKEGFYFIDKGKKEDDTG